MASIRANGLINNLVVTPSVDVPNHYDVIAGGRRIFALDKLIGQGHLPEDYAVPCQIVTDNIQELSLAENIVRSDMHPLDEFEAFADLHEQGVTVADIATRFGTSQHYVRQRLRLGRVSEPIRQAVRDGELGVDVLVAYAVTDDQNRQLEVFNENPEAHAYHVKKRLTDKQILSNDRLPIFVGMDAYIEAGGSYTVDLFSKLEDSYLLDDPHLIEKLAQKKLTTHADGLIAEGWKWAEAVIEFSYYEREREFPKRLYADDGEYTQDQKAESGCIVTIDYQGELKTELGLQRKCDLAPSTPSEETVKDSISQSLSDYLANQKLAMLMNSCSNDLDIALDLMVYQLVSQYADVHMRRVLGISPEQGVPDRACDEIIEGYLPSIDGLIDLEAFSQSDNPFHYICWEVPEETKFALFRICTVRLMLQGYRDENTEIHASLAQRMGIDLDMVRDWRPTKDNYWIKLKKAHILKIAAEVLGDKWAKAQSEMKKGDLADLMEQVFAGRSVPGVRSDQIARALAWIPQEMAFGDIPELPPLSTEEVHSGVIDVDSTGKLTVEESTEPAELSEPSSPVAENPTITALRDQVKQDFGDDPRIVVIDGSSKKPQPAPTEPKEEEPQFIVTKHRLHFDEYGVYGTEIPLDEEGNELPAAFL